MNDKTMKQPFAKDFSKVKVIEYGEHAKDDFLEDIKIFVTGLFSWK